MYNSSKCIASAAHFGISNFSLCTCSISRFCFLASAFFLVDQQWLASRVTPPNVVPHGKLSSRSLPATMCATRISSKSLAVRYPASTNGASYAIHAIWFVLVGHSHTACNRAAENRPHSRPPRYFGVLGTERREALHDGRHFRGNVDATTHHAASLRSLFRIASALSPVSCDSSIALLIRAM
jgi:hypothetical protein